VQPLRLLAAKVLRPTCGRIRRRGYFVSQRCSWCGGLVYGQHQHKSFKNFGRGAMRIAHRLSLVLMFFLFFLAESIAVSNFWGRHEMHLDIYSVSMMPILVAIPLVAGLQIRRKISSAFLEVGANPPRLVNIQYWLASLIALFYAMLSVIMSSLLNAIMHLRH
jgi:hypothetical protein